MPFGAGHYFFGSLTGGEHAFTFKSTASRRPRATSTSPTRSIASCARASASTSSCRRLLAAGERRVPLRVQRGGQFQDVFFPYSTVNGVDAQANVGYRITPMFEVRVVVDFRRYFSSMNC